MLFCFTLKKYNLHIIKHNFFVLHIHTSTWWEFKSWKKDMPRFSKYVSWKIFFVKLIHKTESSVPSLKYKTLLICYDGSEIMKSKKKPMVYFYLSAFVNFLLLFVRFFRLSRSADSNVYFFLLYIFIREIKATEAG